MSKPSVANPGLTEQQELFCREYIKDLNGAKAAVRAGYSERSARSQASRLLTDDNIVSYIQTLKQERTKELKIDANTVLRELLLICKSDLAEAYDDKGYLKPIHKIPPRLRRAIAGIDVFEEYEGFGRERVKVGETRKVKLWNKIDAAGMLAKHLGLLNDKVDHTHTVVIADAMKKARDRVLNNQKQGAKNAKKKSLQSGAETEGSIEVRGESDEGGQDEI